MSKRFALFCCALLLTAALSACAKQYGKGNDTSAPPNEDPDPLLLSCFINHTWYHTDSFTGIIPQEITRLTGIALDVSIAVDESQLALKITSGDLPDLIYTHQRMISRLSSSQYCYSYDEIMEDYGVSWDIPNELRQNALSFSQDGKLYTVINHYSTGKDWEGVMGVPMIGSMSVRQDILDDLGDPKIRTLDDLMDVYALVKERLPGMVPFTFDSEHRFNCFRVWSGLGTADFVETEQGGYRLAIRDERYHEMLKLLNYMYRQGYMIADNFTADNNTSTILYEEGRSFSFASCTQNSNSSRQAKLSQKDPSWISVELPPLEGSAQIVSELGWAATFITRDNPYPKESLEFLRWMFTPEAQRLTQWGREGIEYTLGDDGHPQFSKAWQEALENGTMNTIYNPWFYFGSSATVEAIGRCATLDWPLYEETYESIRDNYENQPWIAAALPAGQTQEREAYDQILDVTAMYEAKVILSDTDQMFEQNYNEYMDRVELLGSSRLEGYMSRKIPEMREKYEP